MDLNLAWPMQSLCYAVIKKLFYLGNNSKLLYNFGQRVSLMFVMWSCVENDDLVHIFLTYLHFAVDVLKTNLGEIKAD